MYNAYKFRLYPNTSKLELINRMFGCNKYSQYGIVSVLRGLPIFIILSPIS